MKKTSIVIPAYNEEKFISKTIKKIRESLKEAELIVVDDGSKDNTAEIAKESGAKVIKLNKNMGKGFAVKRGMLEAEGDYIIFTDADLPFGAVLIPDIRKKLKDSDLVFVRKIKEDKSNLYFIARYFVKKFISLLFGISVGDTQAGLKGFKKQIAKDIFSKTKVSGFAFDVEIFYLAKKAGYKLKYIDFEVRGGAFRKSHFTFLEGLYFIFDLIRIRFARYNK